MISFNYSISSDKLKNKIKIYELNYKNFNYYSVVTNYSTLIVQKKEYYFQASTIGV